MLKNLTINTDKSLNAAKRARLIRAGADIIVPDFSQLPHLVKLLQFSGE